MHLNFKTVIVIILFVASLTYQSFAQISKVDTALYLYFDKGELSTSLKSVSGNIFAHSYSNGDYSKIEGDTNHELKIGIRPPYTFYIKPLFSFVGMTIDGYNRIPSDTISLKESKKLKIVTYSELETFLKNAYKERNPSEYGENTFQTPPSPDPLGQASFWNSLRHIYMVEFYKKKKIVVLTEVKQVADVE